MSRTLPPPGATAVWLGNSILVDPPFGQCRRLVNARYGWRDASGDGVVAPPAAIGGSYLSDLSLPATAPLGTAPEAYPETVPNTGERTWRARAGLFRPDVVVVLYGENDYLYTSPYPGNNAVTPLMFRRACRNTFGGLAALPTAPLLVVVGLSLVSYALVAGLPSWATSVDNAQDQLDAIMQEEAQRAGGLFVPLRPTMTPAMMGSDGIHPTTTDGHRFIAERIFAVLGPPA